jgi:aerobic-type carbon monoxide dehydrogenase small subunit (CoxS/CutS family)
MEKYMPEYKVTLSINGHSATVMTSPNRTLLSILREDLGLTGTKEGCSHGDCGACIVVMNGMAVNSCLVLATQTQGADILTIEGLAENGSLHVLQQSFIEAGAIQCGYCTPGMIMSSYALLKSNPNPTVSEIRTAISGNLCRCTGYEAIIQAITLAAGKVNLELSEESK